jgi:hypothetical protein
MYVINTNKWADLLITNCMSQRGTYTTSEVFCLRNKTLACETHYDNSAYELKAHHIRVVTSFAASFSVYNISVSFLYQEINKKSGLLD